MSKLLLSLRACLSGVGLSAAVMACAPIQAQPVTGTASPRAGPETTASIWAKELRARGVKRFTFSGWAGPALPIWYFRPAGVAADAPILFVFHGVRRDADRYISEWLDVAAREKVLVVVPEFGSDAFPGARAYNHGNLFDAQGAANPTAQRSFSLIEPLFDDLRAREGLTRHQYWMFGHSAGAQFVHRFVMTGHARRLERAVSANAGSYMMPDARVNWPFGLGTLPEGLWNPATAYGTRMTVLLGTADNDPDYPSLPRDPEAMAQGPHRFARGQNFFAAARADAARTTANFAWSCALAPGVGHENGKMAPFGIAVLKQRPGIKPCP